MAPEKTLEKPIRWETHDRGERTVVVGLLADPELPTALAEQLAKDLPDVLADKPRDGMRYAFVVVSETLRRRGGDRGERLIDLTAERREREGWDFAIGLTDLPVHVRTTRPSSGAGSAPEGKRGVTPQGELPIHPAVAGPPGTWECSFGGEVEIGGF